MVKIDCSQFSQWESLLTNVVPHTHNLFYTILIDSVKEQGEKKNNFHQTKYFTPMKLKATQRLNTNRKIKHGTSVKVALTLNFNR